MSKAFRTTYAGAYGTWVPTITAETGTFTTVSSSGAQFTQIGRLVLWAVNFTITTAGTANNGFRFTLPHTPSSTHLGNGRCSTTGFELHVTHIGSGVAQVNKYDNTTTIASGNNLQVSGHYFV